MFKHLLPTASAALLCAATLAFPASAQTPAAAPNFVSNGNFETDENADQWPDDWAQLKSGGSYEVEPGNHFLRLTSPEAGKMILLYREIRVPAGTRAVELAWKQRVSNLKRGKQSWYDARIMMNWLDNDRNKLKPGPPAPNTGKDTAGWQERSVKFLVPEGATMLALMPSLFQVETGTFDLDDIVLKPTDPAPLEEANKARAAEPAKDAANRQPEAAKPGPDGELLPNGNFQTDENADGTPDKWGAAKAPLVWQTEGDNRFLRITAPEPDKMVLYYRLVNLPADAKALEFKWKQRITDLKPGKQAWYDARIMMDFKDATGQKVKGGPGAPYARKSTDGWVERSIQFLVPEGAVSLEIMPSLFQVEKGTFDLDDLSLKATDPKPILEKQARADADAKFVNVTPETPNKAKWPSELHIVGNRVLDKDNKEVRLRGMNVVSLEWSVRGERILRNMLLSIDEWKSNAIRLPVKEEYWFGTNPEQKDGGASYRELVDNAITIAANRGSYVLLDLHRFRAPKKVHADFWKDAAAKYKNHPAVLFDIFNEPHGISWEVWRDGGFVADKNAPADEDAFLTPQEKALNAKGFHSVGIQALVDAARSTGAKNIIVAGGLDWAYDLSGIAKGFTLDDKGGNGIMLATHIYAGKRDWEKKVLSVAGKYPIVVSEFGANDKKFAFIPAEAQEDASTWVPKIFGFIEKHKFHYTAFSFHPGAAPRMLAGWDYTPTPEWGAVVKRALAGERFADMGMR